MGSEMCIRDSNRRTTKNRGLIWFLLLHFQHEVIGVCPIAELQRITVSLRGGFYHQSGCLVLNFTGQLDAYSEKQFTTYINEVLASNQLSVVIDLSNIDFIDSC